MTTSQIILLSILAILSLIGYFGASLSKNEGVKILYIILWAFITAVLFATIMVQFGIINKLEKEAKGKCPEYQKIENAYILKQ